MIAVEAELSVTSASEITKSVTPDWPDTMVVVVVAVTAAAEDAVPATTEGRLVSRASIVTVCDGFTDRFGSE